MSQFLGHVCLEAGILAWAQCHAPKAVQNPRQNGTAASLHGVQAEGCKYVGMCPVSTSESRISGVC